MTETMKSYYEQVEMDVDYAALNAESTAEYHEFLIRVRKLVDVRMEVKIAEPPEPLPEEEPQDIEDVTEEVKPQRSDFGLHLEEDPEDGRTQRRKQR